MTFNLEDEIWGWTFLALLFQLTWWLHAFVPAAGGARTAYVTDPTTGEPLRYQTNALRVMLIVVAIVGALVNAELVGASDLAIHFFPAARAAFFFGFCASVLLYNRGEQVLKAGKLDKGTSCTTVAGPRTAAAASTKEFDNLSAVDHFFCGYEWNPRGVSTRIDLKMFCYSFGAILLWLNVLSAAALQYEQEPKGSSNAMLVYTSCMSWFLLEYMFFEHVHLYTYDIFRERLEKGGAESSFTAANIWYPFFYHVGIWALVDAKADLTLEQCVGCAALFALGWSFTRGANMQKHALKTGASSFLGMPLETVPGSNGRLLCSG
eukprot:gene20754-12755_t